MCKVSPAGVVSALAGSATNGYADGTGAGAAFRSPVGVTVHSSGNVFVGDSANHRIRKVTTTGAVTLLAGSGTGAFTDGTGAGAAFNSPRGLSVIASGDIFVADFGNHRIRRVTPVGVVTTLAGSGMYDFADGAGTLASFRNPCDVAVDASGNALVADANNNRIRKLTCAAGTYLSLIHI